MFGSIMINSKYNGTVQFYSNIFPTRISITICFMYPIIMEYNKYAHRFKR